ncbi:MAG: ABC transporter permease [Kiritimatiellae bacterium]|nr:ABC transporter permease [Kiritimatiellia bacterium]
MTKANAMVDQVNCSRNAEGVLTVRLRGAWRFRDERPAPDLVREALTAGGPPTAIALEGSGITDWDSACLIFLQHVCQLASDSDVPLRLEGFAPGIERMLRLAQAVPDRTEAHREQAGGSFLARVGRSALATLDDCKKTMSFLGETVLAFGALFRGRAHMRLVDLWSVIQECGPEALPIVAVISVLVGMILAFLGSIQLKLFGAEVYVADLVGVGMVREMGALMTGIIMAGRTGASFAARLGTMQVNEEVDALQTMGFSPMEFLVLPRMSALILMMPLLTIFSNVLGILGGAVVGVLMMDLTPTQYYLETVKSLTFEAVASGLIKSVVFGVLVAFSGCMQGIRCGRSASAVGDATTSAVVHAIVYIIVADSILSIIYTLTGF